MNHTALTRASLLAVLLIAALPAARTQPITIQNTGYAISFDPQVFGTDYSYGPSSVLWTGLYDAAIQTSAVHASHSASLSLPGSFTLTPNAGRQIDSIVYTLKAGDSMFNGGYQIWAPGTGANAAAGYASADLSLTALVSPASAATAATHIVGVDQSNALQTRGYNLNAFDAPNLASYHTDLLTTVRSTDVFGHPAAVRGVLGTASYVLTQDLADIKTDANGNYLNQTAGWSHALDGTITLDATIMAAFGANAEISLTSFMITVNTSKIPALPTSPVPEPESYALLLAGLSLLATVARRRRGQPRRLAWDGQA